MTDWSIEVGVLLLVLCLSAPGWAEPGNEPVAESASATEAADAARDGEAAGGPSDIRQVEEEYEYLSDEEPDAEKEEDPYADVETMKVTGRRREEMLQEVPVSIRAFDANELNSRNISRIDEIGFGTANLTFDSTNGSNRNARIYIRGIGQDDPRTIVDPAIGMYIDNVYIPRATNALFDVTDFERIEVLRGPQGTLYGKNTVGGVINIVTKKPGTEFGGFVDLNAGSFKLFEAKGAVDIPVKLGWFEDKLFTRWMVATATEDGYTTNVATGEDAGDNRLLAVRGSARLLPIDGLIIDLVADWSQQGERAVIGKCRAANPFNIARYVTDNFSGSGPGDRFLDWCGFSQGLGPHQGVAIPLQKTTTDTVGTSLTIDYQLPDGATGFTDFINIKSITGYRQRNDDVSGSDADGTPLFYIGGAGSSIEHWAVSQDLNFNIGFWDERVDLIIGGYFFMEEGDEQATSAILREMATGADAEFNVETYPNTVQVLNETLAPAFNLPPQPQAFWNFLGLANSGAPGNETGDIFWRNAIRWGIGELNATRYQQWQNTSYAAYAHTDVEVVQDVTLQAGIRYTDESKSRGGIDERVYFSALNTSGPPPFTITPPTNPPGSGTPRRVLPQAVSFSRWTPEAGVKWQVTDEHMTYFRYARGWKSGGLRVTALTEEEAARRSIQFLLPYEPEEVDTYEVGLKTQWFDNQLIGNLTLFWNDYRNLQVTSLEPDERGIVSALINNAEAAVTRGFEIEGSYLPDWAEKIPLPGSTIMMTTGIGFTDAFYTTFTGTQAVPATDVTGCASLLRGVSAQCDLVIDRFALNTLIFATGLAPPPTPLSVDLSNNEFKNTPRFNINASFTYVFEPVRNTELALRVDWAYRSTVYYTTINDPALSSPPLNLLNLSAAFDIVKTDTQLVFWVKNVTNEIPLSGALSLGSALGADAQFYGKPRTFGGRIIQRF